MGEVVIVRGQGGLNRQSPSADGTIGIIGTGYPGMATDSLYFRSLNDVEANGITQANDVVNGISLWARFSEIYRLNSGAEVFFKPVANTVTLANMLANYGVGIIEEARGKVRHLGIFRHPAVGYTPTITDGLDADVLAALTQAHAVATVAQELNMPIHAYVEGRSFTGSPASAKNLRSYTFPDVSVVVALDEKLHPLNSGNSCVETVLGLVSRSRVNDSIAWVEPNNIQDPTVGSWSTAYLSSGLPLSSYTAAGLSTLNAYGYIIPKMYPRESSTPYTGIYLNDSHSCVSISSDYAYLTDSNVMNKAHRLVYNAVLPQLNSTVIVDRSTGKLPADVCKYYESLAHKQLRTMEANGEISGFDVYVNPDQNILATGNLYIEYTIIPTGTARAITNTIGFRNPFN